MGFTHGYSLSNPALAEALAGITTGATITVEWLVEGVDTDFTHTAPVDPSGNALGPFTIGQVVKLRTRVTNANGTTTGSVRTLTILNPNA